MRLVVVIALGSLIISAAMFAGILGVIEVATR